jgi:hypothetical protein
MAQQIVNVGTYPSDHTGDPLRIAFTKINENFTDIYNGNVSVNGTVSSVAGRTGNVVLNVNDVFGAASFANVAAASLYTMGNYHNWNGNVTTISSALDQLAARLKSAGF